MEAQEEQGVPKQEGDPRGVCGCPVCDMGGGQPHLSVRGQILQGCLKGYRKRIGLYPEGTREPLKSFKQGEDMVLEGSCWQLYGECPRGQDWGQWSSEGPLV